MHSDIDDKPEATQDGTIAPASVWVVVGGTPLRPELQLAMAHTVPAGWLTVRYAGATVASARCVHCGMHFLAHSADLQCQVKLRTGTYWRSM